jgi:myo-inositol-1(or 4)-monophosphatase
MFYNINALCIEIRAYKLFSVIINKAFVGLCLPYSYEKYRPFRNKFFPCLYGSTFGIRIYGSAAVNLCYVAAGRFDFWLEAFIKPCKKSPLRACAASA